MKWAIVALCALGLLAAGAAAVLVTSLQGGASDGTALHVVERSVPAMVAELPVAVAARDLPAFAVVRAEDVDVVEARSDAAPRNALADPLEVIGRLLGTPMVAGQPFLAGAFVEEGSAQQLARSLGPGRRAMSITLDDGSGLEQLLYPGSVVDVLATFVQRTPDGEWPITITLLEAIRVLAIGERTVVDPFATSNDPRAVGRARPSVSLLVDGEQANKLKLAMEEGRVSLALRDPGDEQGAGRSVGPTGLAQLSPALAAPAPAAPPSAEPTPEPTPTAPVRELVILRGGERETKTFPDAEVRR